MRNTVMRQKCERQRILLSMAWDSAPNFHTHSTEEAEKRMETFHMFNKGLMVMLESDSLTVVRVVI